MNQGAEKNQGAEMDQSSDRNQIQQLIENLTNDNNKLAYQALKQLIDLSRSSDQVYAYFDQFAALLDHENSLERNRAIDLIAENARWDTDYKVDEIIDAYLRHLQDGKPITTRQCVQMLPLIAESKPELKEVILEKLECIDLSIYPDSMQSLILKDMQKARKTILK